MQGRVMGRRAIRMEQAMNVHKCDGHGKVDFAFLKSMFRRADVEFLKRLIPLAIRAVLPLKLQSDPEVPPKAL